MVSKIAYFGRRKYYLYDVFETRKEAYNNAVYFKKKREKQMENTNNRSRMGIPIQKIRIIPT